jgi:LEA14-like dessication related protein
MQYTIKVKTGRVRQFTNKKFVIDLFLSFQNNSTLTIDIIGQEHKVYINDKLISTIKNLAQNTILPKTESIIAVNLELNPTNVLNVVKKSFANILLNPESVVIRVDSNMKVRFYGITLSLPSVFEDNLKNMLLKRQENK